MSSSESSSSEPELISKRTKKSEERVRKNKRKAKSKAAEGDVEANPDLTYKPPAGSVLINHEVDSGEFDWDAVQDDDNLEIWMVRVPEGVKARHLQDVKLEAPPPSKTIRVGSIERKHTSYDVWSLGEDKADYMGGEEVKGLSCLLPRRQKGAALYQAPKPIARHLVITAKPVLPTPDPSLAETGSDSTSSPYKNAARYRYPMEVLKHRFMPLGSLANVGGSPESMDVDQVEEMLETTQGEQLPITDAQGELSGEAEVEEVVKKKRKGDGAHKKKSKKTKTAAEIV